MFRNLFASKIEYDFLLLNVKLTSILIPLWIIDQHPPKEIKWGLWGFSVWRLLDLMTWGSDLWLERTGGIGL